MGRGCISWTSAPLRCEHALFLEAFQSERCWDPDEREGFMTVLKNVLCSIVTPYGAAAPALPMACCGHLVLSSGQTIDCSDASMFVQLDPAAFSFPSFPPHHSLLILFWLVSSSYASFSCLTLSEALFSGLHIFMNTVFISPLIKKSVLKEFLKMLFSQFTLKPLTWAHKQNDGMP